MQQSLRQQHVLYSFLLTWELGFTKVILEGDSLHIITALNSTKDDWVSIGHLVSDAQLLTNQFELCSLSTNQKKKKTFVALVMY